MMFIAKINKFSYIHKGFQYHSVQYLPFDGKTGAPLFVLKNPILLLC